MSLLDRINDARPVPSIGMYDNNHKYYWRGEGPLPSVTAITGWQDSLGGSGGLTTWAAKLAVEYLIDNLTTFEDESGMAALRADAVASINKARDVGSAVHGKIEDFLSGRVPTRTDQTGAYLDGFTLFLAERHPEFLEREQVVLSPTYGYAGRFDFIAKIDGRIALVDTKTGKAKPSHRLQLAAYGMADFIGKPDDDTEYPLPRIRDYYILLLREGSYELVAQPVSRSDRRHFVELARSYQKAKAWEKAARAR